MSRFPRIARMCWLSLHQQSLTVGPAKLCSSTEARGGSSRGRSLWAPCSTKDTKSWKGLKLAIEL